MTLQSHEADFERTIGFGENALKFLKRNGNPAYPRNYEIWYTYSAGYNRDLNRAINGALDRQEHIDSALLERIYEEFISPTSLADQVGVTGEKVSEEIDQLLQRLEASSGNVGEYGAQLREAATTLSNADTQSAALVIKQVLIATRSMEERNALLEQQLNDSKEQISDLQHSLEAVRTETITDALTGLANRRHFDQSLERLMVQGRREDTPVCLVMGDIDHFKSFNDTYGHQTGDQVLKLVGMTIKQSVKGRDVATRYGGEEFGMILPQTAMDSAKIVAEQVRTAVQTKELVKRSTGETLGRISMSFGIAMMNDEDTPETILARADAALYKSKRDGRNRTTTENQLTADDRKAVA